MSYMGEEILPLLDSKDDSDQDFEELDGCNSRARSTKSRTAGMATWGIN